MASPVRQMCETETAVIANGASLSGVVSLRGRVVVAVQMPSSGWTAAGLTFQGSTDGVTYFNLFNETAEIACTAVDAGRIIGLDNVFLLGVKFFKVRSGTSGAPVNQAAERTLTLVLADWQD